MMDFEPALLEELGYEVYIPKLFPQTPEFSSAAVTYEFDSRLTIPADALELLNNYNFYTTRLPPKIRRIINTYFGIAFVISIPLILEQVFEDFKGHIVFHAFGLDRSINYNAALKMVFGEGIHDVIARLGSRFHFGIAYLNLVKSEPDYLKSRAIFLPIGLPPRFFSQGGTWIGEDPRLFFICPKIQENPYYGNVYREFKKDFNDIPHIIAGWQGQEVDDPCVAGSIDRTTFDNFLRSLRLMYYHSREPYHVHYHPLEAMATGMPVVFMKDSLLGQMDTSGLKQSGACRNIAEAKNKIRRILAGDKNLIEEIKNAQKRILIPFTHDFCLAEWQKNFIPAIQEKNLVPLSRPPRIAVMLPTAYKSGTFYAAKAIAKMIHVGSRKVGNPVEVVFSCLIDQYNLEEELEDLKELGICIRETRWDLVNRPDVERMMRLEGRTVTLEYSQYIIPRDGMRDFLDADFWLIVSDSVMFAPVPLRRYAVVIHDCLSRYFPEYQNTALDGRVSIARTADIVIATTPQTREEIISFHGVSPDKVFLFPNEFGMTQVDVNLVSDTRENYFVWSTNPSPHKNIIRALDALLQYYSEGGNLSVIITGSLTEQFDEELIKDEAVIYPVAKEIKKKIQDSKILRDKIIIRGNLSKEEYYKVVSKACFVWHPALYDNGTFCVIEAAALGTPGLSADYPQMQFLDSTYELHLAFFDPHSNKKMCLALHYMEKEWQNRKSMLPPAEHILKQGWDIMAESYWKMLSELL